MSILVTYASSHGSTKEIAERIASRIETYSQPVECLSIQDVKPASLPNYSTIIIGSAIHMLSWLTPARNFIHTNKETLKTKAVWAFSVGFPEKEEERVNEENMVGKKLAGDLPNMKGHKLFQGKFEKKDLGWFMGMIFTCCVPKKKTHWGDNRHWEDIEAWADEIGKQIRAGADVISA